MKILLNLVSLLCFTSIAAAKIEHRLRDARRRLQEDPTCPDSSASQCGDVVPASFPKDIKTLWNTPNPGCESNQGGDGLSGIKCDDETFPYCIECAPGFKACAVCKDGYVLDDEGQCELDGVLLTFDELDCPTSIYCRIPDGYMDFYWYGLSVFQGDEDYVGGYWDPYKTFWNTDVVSKPNIAASWTRYSYIYMTAFYPNLFRPISMDIGSNYEATEITVDALTESGQWLSFSFPTPVPGETTKINFPDTFVGVRRLVFNTGNTYTYGKVLFIDNLKIKMDETI